MTGTRSDFPGTEKRPGEAGEAQYERWHHWHVNWTAIWVGALGALSAALIFGLIGIAVGAHMLRAEDRMVDLTKMSRGALIFNVCGAFFAFVIGGWIAGKVAGILHAEPAALHGAIVWLVAVPVLMVFAGLGAGSLFGGWHAGLAGTPSGANSATTPFDRPDPLGAGATDEERVRYQADLAVYNQKVIQWREDTPRVVRNGALGAVTALLLGLIGSVIGGWMACGEPMSLTYRRAHHAQGQRVLT